MDVYYADLCLRTFISVLLIIILNNFVLICCDVFSFDVRSNQSLSTVYTMEILFNIKRVEIVLCPLYFLFLGALLLNHHMLVFIFNGILLGHEMAADLQCVLCFWCVFISA